MPLRTPIRTIFLLMLAVLALPACTVQLAPAYDDALYEGLVEANEDALELFAKVESGSEPEEFDDYESDYAELIGSFDALRNRAATRYVPPLSGRLRDLRIVEAYCDSRSDPDACVNATPTSLANLLDNLRRMRDVHRERGLASGAVEAFRNRYYIQIDQALTVENALRR